MRKLSAKYYQAHKPAWAAYNKTLRDKLRAFVNEQKAAPCKDCGVKHPPYVMDFDHVSGKKIGNVAILVGSQSSFQKLMAEIAKCDLVCANCHRIRTHKRHQEKLNRKAKTGAADLSSLH